MVDKVAQLSTGPLFAVMWRRGRGAPWHLQPSLYPEAAAIALAEKMLVRFDGESAIAELEPPAEIVDPRELVG